MPSHRARGFGRYVRFRAALPRHAATGPAGPRRLTPLFLVAGLLSATGVTLIALRVDQLGTLPSPTPQVEAPPPVVRVPVPYRPQWAVAQVFRQAAKHRPPVLLGAADTDALTRYCIHKTGPLSEAALISGGWTCKPLFGRPAKIRIAKACRFLYGEEAWARPADRDDPRSWRCYRTGP